MLSNKVLEASKKRLMRIEVDVVVRNQDDICIRSGRDESWLIGQSRSVGVALHDTGS